MGWRKRGLWGWDRRPVSLDIYYVLLSAKFEEKWVLRKNNQCWTFSRVMRPPRCSKRIASSSLQVLGVNSVYEVEVLEDASV